MMKKRDHHDKSYFPRIISCLVLVMAALVVLPGTLPAQRAVAPLVRQSAPPQLYGTGRAEIAITRIKGNYITRNTPSKLEISWRDTTRTCRLYFSTNPGSSPEEYDQPIGPEGRGRLLISSGFEVLPVGIYYSILKDSRDPNITSVPFVVYVQPEVPVNMVLPADGAVVEGGNPEFRWDPIAGVPYYLLILSQGDLTVVNDEETGEFKSLSGVNIIWQAFSAQPSIRYGDSDLSGTWPENNTPPLLPGVEYNWLVFSAFAPDLRYVAWDLYPLATSSFQVDRPALPKAPEVFFPVEGVQVDEDEITFLWYGVPGATRYHVLLHERLQQSDIGEGTILLWHHITVDSSAFFRAREFLAGSEYVLRIVAESPTGLSYSREHTFQYRPQKFYARIFVSDRDTWAGIPFARVDFTGWGGTGPPFSFFTDEYARLELNLPRREYTIRASAPDFQHDEQVLIPGATDTTLFLVEMEQAEFVAIGKVVDPEGRPIPFTTVTTGDDIRIRTDGAGHFNLPLKRIPSRITFFAHGYTTRRLSSLQANEWGIITLGEVTLVPTFSSLRVTSVDENGLPLSGVKFTMIRENEKVVLTSGAGGTAEFPLASGLWRIIPDYPGYFSSPEEYYVQMEDGSRPELTFVFSPAAVFEGRVFFDDELVAGATVELISRQGVSRRTESDNYGVFHLGAPGGLHDVRVHHEQFGTWQAEVTLRTGTVTRFDVLLEPASVIWGTVINTADDQALAGAKVYDRRSRRFLATTNAAGVFAFTAEAGQEYLLEAELEGYASRAVRQVVAVARDSVRVDLLLEPATAVLKGRVLNANGPVAGALVRLLETGSTVVTDLFGQYEMPVKSGTWRVQAEANCLTSVIRQVSIAPGETKILDLNLSGESAVVSGRVRDSAGRPLADANIFAVGDKNVTAESDSTGAYTLCLDPGAYYILVSRIGYLSADTTLLLTTAQSLTGIDFFLQENFATVIGRAEDEDGNPVADLQVILTNAWQNRVTTTDANGVFRFERIYPGQALLLIRSQRYSVPPLSLELQGGEEARPTLVLRRNDGFISGRVIDGFTGTGIDSAFVAAREYGGGSIFTSSTMDSTGAFRIENLPTGNSLFRVFASKDGYVLDQPVDSVVASSSGITLKLFARNASLAGTVVDAGSGEPVAGVVVRVTRPGESLRQTTTTEAGEFTIPGLVFTFDYQVTLSHGLFFPDTFQVRAPASGIRLPLQRRLGFLAGQVRENGSAVPVADALVVMTNIDGTGRSDSTRTDAAGRYVAGVWPGRYRVSVSAPFFYATPNQQLLQITPEDTTEAEVFLLEKQTLASLQLSGPARVFADQGEALFIVSARDSIGRAISNVPSLRWQATPAPDTVMISQNGLLKIAPRFLGPIQITVEDTLSSRRASLMTTAYARIDSGTSAVYYSRSGMVVDFLPGTVSSPVEISLATAALTPVQRVENEFRLLEPVHRLLPDNLPFERDVRLELPIPDQGVSRMQGDYAILRWNSIFSAWEAEDLDRLRQPALPGDRLLRTITMSGDYAIVLQSGPLAIRELRIQPNPFSPRQINRFGESGTAIMFDITTNQAALPLITAKIYNLEGELVRVLANQEPFPKGLQHLSWDGRARDGRLLRNGRYMLHFVVDDGTAVQEQIRSIVLIQ